MDQPHGEINLAEYWDTVRKHQRLVAICVAACVLAAVVISVVSTPTYKATAVLNVEREKASPMDVTGNAPAYAPFDPEFVPTQTRLMRSREIGERVVERLRLAQNPLFGPMESGFAGAKTSTDVSRIAMKVQEAVETRPQRGTALVELSATTPSPKLSADIANAVAEAYIDWNIEAKFLVVGQATRFLTTQLEQLKSEIDEKERQLQAYGRQKDIISTDPKANITLQNLESLNKDYADAVADRVAKEARYYELQTARPEAVADSLSNGLITQLRNDQAKLEREYAEKLNLYKPDWPAMQQLRAQIEKSKQHLVSVTQETVTKARDVARTEYQMAARREQSLKAVMAGQKSEAMTLNSNAVEYNNLKTEVDTKRTLLDTLLKRQAETEVTSRLRGERISNVRIVDRALVPTERFRPSYKRNGALGLIAGIALGLGLAFFLEYLDRSLRSVEQVEKYLGLPALGVIPAVGSANANVYSYGYGRAKAQRKLRAAGDDKVAIELLPHTHPRATVAESYRAFRTALLLSRAGGLKSLVVTSSHPGEGKTSTAINLAVVLAQLGKRVLLVDGDLHKPRVHEVFKVSNRTGLVSILAENLEAATAIKPSSVPGLFLIPAGPTSPNPSGLLSSPAMERFVEVARQNFDYVVIDAPPVGAVADAILIGYQVDGAVLTVRGGKTPREQVARTRDRLVRSNVRVLGVLINNLEAQRERYGYYSQYYGGSKGYTEDLPGTTAAGA
ncbi:MAG: polysaccharide biosynthesis tyrosine autokinase [Thermoanaerobaculia bacterium]